MAMAIQAQSESRDRDRSRDGGSILVVALILSLLTMALLSSTAMLALSASKDSQFRLDQTEATTLAEGVVEVALHNMLQKLADFETFELYGTVTLGNQSYPYTISPIGGEIQRTDPDGVFTNVQAYVISATIPIRKNQSTIKRVVEVNQTPIVQYMVLFHDDLEILPGAGMVLEGRIHSNGNIYIGCGATSTLTVDTDYFRAAGKILRERKDQVDIETGGEVLIKVMGKDTFKSFDPDLDEENPAWVALALSKWKGTVQSGAHGVKKAAIPDIKSIQAYNPETGAKGFYHERASLVIRNGQAYDPDGNLVPLPPGTITEGPLYDAREGGFLTVTTVDMSLLNTSAFPSNGLLYAYRTDASEAQPNGIRLINGSELAAPLTVVTQNPVYIQGDFNTVNKKGACVISDAMNLLSNAWDNTRNSQFNLSEASETTYNLAMITGQVATPEEGGTYSGGLENFPRFHERWSNAQGRVACNINGAFINLFDCKYATTPWIGGSEVYTIPLRNYRFDKDMLNPSFMPPYPPNAVAVNRVLWDDGVPSTLAGN